MEIVGTDTAFSVDTVTARINATVLLDDGETAASVWKFDPYFIDVDESRPESLLVSSLGLNTRTVGDTIRIYGNSSPAGLRHTIYLKEYSPRPGELVIFEWDMNCGLSRPEGWEAVPSPTNKFRRAFWVGTWCFAQYIRLGSDIRGTLQRQRTMSFQPHVGFVEIRQRYEDSNSGTIHHTWRLLSYHIANPGSSD